LGRAGKFLHLSFREKLLFAEAFLLHLGTGLLLKAVPFRRIPRLFRSQQSPVGGQQSDTVYLIREAVARAGRVSPWKNRCLVSSLAARCMLNRRNIPSSLSLGLSKKSDGQTAAHAWLKSCDIEVVEKNGEHTELYTF
jgi:hypothetical protein